MMTEEKTSSAFELCRLGDQKKSASELYLVTCKVQSFQTVGDAIRPVAFRRFDTREVTIIYLSFTNCRISLVLPTGCVTLTGGKPKRTRRQA
jgi:hypothetical protein